MPNSHTWMGWLKDHLGWVSAGSISLALVVLLMLRGMLYRKTLRAIEASRVKLFAMSPADRGKMFRGDETVLIPWANVTEDMILKNARIPRWWGKWALNWKSDKKKGLV